VAPALRSLIIRTRHDMLRIVKILCDSHVDIRKLVLINCYLRGDSAGFLTDIVTLYPDLDALSLIECRSLHFTVYSVIPHLKKLSELQLSGCEVHCVYVQLLQTDVCICEHIKQKLIEIHFIYLGKKEIYSIFKTCHLISVLFSTN
jgi:hypothetical protein